MEYVKAWVPEGSKDEPGAKPLNRRGEVCGVSREVGVWAPESLRGVEVRQQVSWQDGGSGGGKIKAQLFGFLEGDRLDAWEAGSPKARLLSSPVGWQLGVGAVSLPPGKRA